MPGNRLALAIGVGGEDQAIRILHSLGNFAEPLSGRGVDAPGHGEILVRTHRSVLRRQVADMTEGRQNLIVAAQILIDCLRLGRQFDDDNVHENSFG